MPNPTNGSKAPSVNANHNSNAVGSISAGGDISGNIHIGNVYQTPEDDLPLSSDEIENGLTRFAQFLPERAPVLQDSFSSIAKKLRATLGADQNSLSPALKSQREDGVNRMKLMCMEVTDISFRAICLGQNPPPYDSRPPFLGLFAFRPEDREFFFGRDALVQKLVARIKAHPFLAVLGASGSGKSSLVMAGLVPALEAQMSYLTPSSAPLSQLLTAKESASAKTVFVIDQFEELFTHPHDAAERADFIHALLELAKTNRVVITMRADFWGEVAIYADLKQAMQEHQELIAPMTVDELHSAMEKQAAVVGLRFDPTLSESILAEVKGEPGAMPLLQHALWELWNRRHGLWIKAEEYQAFGGVKQAIASTAEEVYASCSDFERARVRDIFLRLTRLDESGEGRDTRRRVLIEELIPVNSDSSVTINLLNKLADARLIVKTDKDVEVAHEALIRHWSRLTEWLNEDRDNLRLRESVSESAREWENSKRDDSLLNHRGGRLELALAMSKLPRYHLNPIEQAYLNACVSLREKIKTEREQQKQWIISISIAVSVVMIVLAAISFYQADIAKEKARIAHANEIAIYSLYNLNKQIDISLLLSTQAFQLNKNDVTNSALIGALNYSPYIDALLFPTIELVKETNQDIVTLSISPDGKLLAAGLFNGKVVLFDLISRRIVKILDGYYIPDESISPGVILIAVYPEKILFSPNGKILILASPGVPIQLWDVEQGTLIREIDEAIATRNDVAVNSDGTTLVSATSIDIIDNSSGLPLVAATHYRLRIWNLLSGEKIEEIHDPCGDASIWSLAFSPVKNQVAIGCGNGLIKILDTDSKEIINEYSGQQDAINVLTFSSDGKILASGGWDKSIRLWDTISDQTILNNNEHANTEPIGNLFLSSDNHFLITQESGKVFVWNVVTGNKTETEISNLQSNIIISPNGEDILFSQNNVVMVWKINPTDFKCTENIFCILDSPKFVNKIVYNPDGAYIVSLSSESTIQFWDFLNRKLLTEVTDVGIVDFAISDTGDKLGWVTNFGIVHIYDIESRQEVDQYNLGVEQLDRYVGLSFSSDLSIFAAAIPYTSSYKVWNIKEHKLVFEFSGHSGQVNSIAISPDKKIIATASEDHNVILWDISTLQRVQQYYFADWIRTLQFGPDGKKLAIGLSNGTVEILDLTRGNQNTGQIQNYKDLSEIEISSDNNTIAVIDSTNKVFLWDINTQNSFGEINTNYDFPVALSISPDTNYLAVGGNNGIVIWKINPSYWLNRACEIAGRNFTHDEWTKYFPDEKYRETCPQWHLESAITPTLMP